jgi:hypothetical protein
MGQITNIGRRWIQHGDNYIVLTNIPSITNPQITATIHLPVLATGDVTVRGSQHSSPTPPIAPTFAAGSMINISTLASTETVNGDTYYKAHIRLNGGYGFTVGGSDTVNTLNTNERFDDVAQTQTARTGIVQRNKLTAYSLNGFGYVAGGENPVGTVVGSHIRFDDVTNVATLRDLITSRDGLTAYTINGYGFTSCGYNGTARTGLTERFDDSVNANTTRTSATARDLLSGLGLNNYGFTAEGQIAGAISVTTVERFNDVVNTQTARADNSAGFALAGYSLTAAISGSPLGQGVVLTDVDLVGGAFLIYYINDVSNTRDAGIVAGVGKRYLTGYSLNGFGFHSGGINSDLSVSNVVQRYDGVGKFLTSVVVLNTARSGLASFATNEYFVNYDTLEP